MDCSEVVTQFCVQVSNIADVLEDTVTEIRWQTDRERKLELQVVGIVQRLRSLTVKSTKDQKKLEEECHQATAKLEQGRGDLLVKRQQTEEVLQNVDKAKHELMQLKQFHDMEQATLDEYYKACARLLHRGLAGDHIEGHCSAMKSQETSSPEVEKLSVESQERVSEYTKIKAKQTLLRYSYYEKQQTLDREVRSALIRQDKLEDEFSKNDKRRETWQRDLHQSAKEMDTFDQEVRESVKRQRKLQYVKDQKMTVEKAKADACDADSRLHGELGLAEDNEKEFEQELNASSERTRKLCQEISQIDKRRHWLDQLKSTSDFDDSARELFQQTSSENDLLKQRLQQVMKIEEDLSKRLQQAQENTKVLKRELVLASESLKNLQEKLRHSWNESTQADTSLVLENEIKLQELLNEAYKREQRAEEETNLALSKEVELHMKLNRVSERESIFKVPIRQLKYSESGMSFVVFIHHWDSRTLFSHFGCMSELAIAVSTVIANFQ